MYEVRNVRIHHRLLLIASIAAIFLTGCRSLRDARSSVVDEYPAATAESPLVYPLPDSDETVTVEIVRWRDDARAAISITFDDGTLDQYVLAAPALEAYGFQGTFFLIPGLMDAGVWKDGETNRLLFSWSAAANLAERGHEIGAHTMTHPDLSVADLQTVDQELGDSRDLLQARIPGLRVRTAAWPYWRSTAETRAIGNRYYLGMRSGVASTARYHEVGVPPAVPENRMAVNALALLPAADPDQWIALSEQVLATGGWGVLSLHGVDDGAIASGALGWQALPLWQLSLTLEHLRDPLYWVAGFGTVMQYIDRREQTRLLVRGATAGRLTLLVDAPPDDGSLAEPITVSLRLPPVWNEVNVVVDGRPIPTANVKDRLVFDLPLDAQSILITRR